MKQLFSILSSLLFSVAVFSQDKTFPITGTVIDAKTKLPMSNASVFCQNTTIGTITNADGKFFMRLNKGGYDLVTSYTGYETKSMRISNGNPENDSLIIEMSEKDKSMEQVVVAGSAEVADGLTKYGDFFIDNFIGTSPNASHCIIENKDAPVRDLTAARHRDLSQRFASREYGAFSRSTVSVLMPTRNSVCGAGPSSCRPLLSQTNRQRQ